MNWQERAEKAEAELVKWRTACHAGKAQVEGLQATLAKAREQKPITYVFDPNGYAIDGKHTEIADALPTGMDLYAAPVPAVAEPDAKTAGIIKRLRDACPAGSGCKCMVNDAASELERLSALLQYAPQSAAQAEVRHD